MNGMNICKIFLKFNILSISLLVSTIISCTSNIPILRDIPSCCLISPPDIHLTGEKTVVERQIVGDYKELEKDAWIISSVRTNIQRSKRTITGGDEFILKALKIREFHEDKIRRYKDQGAVGEKNNGFIAYIRHPEYESDKNLKSILISVTEEENKARKIIFERTLIKSGIKDPTEKNIDAFGSRIFAKEQRALALKNDFIQNNNGRWVRKK